MDMPISKCRSRELKSELSKIIFAKNYNPMLIKDSNITITISDIDKSIAFYSSLGFTVKNRWGNYYAQLTAPGITIGLHPSSADKLTGNSGNISIGFTMENIEETKNHLKNYSVNFQEREEEGGKFLHFKDPDGTALYFI